MKAVERILLTANLAPHSDRAMERAVRMAAEFGADLAVLYAMPPIEGTPASVYDRLTANDIEAEVRRHVMAQPMAASLAPMITVMPGPIDELVVDYSALWKPDLVIAGAHPRETSKDLFSVRTVERISVASRAPLLVVRNKPFGPYSSALVAVDFLDSSRPGVEAAMSLVVEGSIHLLHVFDAPEAASAGTLASADGFEAEFAALLDGLEVGRRIVGTSVRPGEAMNEIIEMAQTELPEVIVLGTKGRRGFGRALMGSTAHEVLEHLPSDVLLVRAR